MIHDMRVDHMGIERNWVWTNLAKEFGSDVAARRVLQQVDKIGIHTNTAAAIRLYYSDPGQFSTERLRYR
jgi:hypothetical protein